MIRNERQTIRLYDRVISYRVLGMMNTILKRVDDRKSHLVYRIKCTVATALLGLRAITVHFNEGKPYFCQLNYS